MKTIVGFFMTVLRVILLLWGSLIAEAVSYEKNIQDYDRRHESDGSSRTLEIRGNTWETATSGLTTEEDSWTEYQLFDGDVTPRMYNDGKKGGSKGKKGGSKGKKGGDDEDDDDDGPTVMTPRPTPGGPSKPVPMPTGPSKPVPMRATPSPTQPPTPVPTQPPTPVPTQPRTPVPTQPPTPVPTQPPTPVPTQPPTPVPTQPPTPVPTQPPTPVPTQPPTPVPTQPITCTSTRECIDAINNCSFCNDNNICDPVQCPPAGGCCLINDDSTAQCNDDNCAGDQVIGCIVFIGQCMEVGSDIPLCDESDTECIDSIFN